ncbi:hypothetical protein DFP72DRAFT_1079071 [Ephemerocybe angulata]|uniref:Uncharacterized protein n=1 Tax=Ephemerocybe angulata TaxID=980116 RepID=A0A8H6HD27_9AGAR|nr:hypothetical protein DFP72DRAFT_1079071 [Tulosesus angulatus]
MENEDPLFTFEYDPSLATNNPAPIPAGVQIERWNFKKPSGPKRIRKKQDQAKPRKLKPYERHTSILDASGLRQQSVGVPGPSSHSHASGPTLPPHSTAMAPPDPPGTGLRSFGAEEMVLDDISMMLDDDSRCSTSFSSTSMPTSSAHPMTAPPTPATHHDQYDPMAWASEPTTPFSKHRQSFDTTSSFPSPSPSTENLDRDPSQSSLLLSAASDYSFHNYDSNSSSFERSQSVRAMSAHSSFSVSESQSQHTAMNSFSQERQVQPSAEGLLGSASSRFYLDEQTEPKTERFRCVVLANFVVKLGNHFRGNAAAQCCKSSMLAFLTILRASSLVIPSIQSILVKVEGKKSAHSLTRRDATHS